MRLASISLFACLGLVACGDNVPARPDGGGGGGSGGMGGDGGTGGGAGTTGVAGTDGGAGTGGVAGTDGGAGTGGAAATDGGAGMAGTDGGAGTAGTGGVAGTAGMDGGAGTAGTDGGAPACYSVAFTAPTDGQTLSVNQDRDMNCTNGFQIDVRITTNAPNGTDVSLYSGNTLLRTVDVMNGMATFDVQLPSSGQTALQIQFPDTQPCTAATTRVMVTVNCPMAAPTCTISQPTISPTHPALNGVPVAQGGDRVSAAGSPYQAAFQVTTNIEDGRTVSLAVSNNATPTAITTVTAMAMNGVANFGGITLVPDGTYTVVATCTNMAGIVGQSMSTMYPVDTTPPDLTVSGVTNGQFFGPTQLPIRVCGRTTSADAAGLDAALGARVNNLCIALGGSPSCAGAVPVTAVNTDACFDLACPGAAPFDVNVTLTDAAGNPFTRTVTGVSCASTLPSVQIIRPISDAPAFGDPARRILSATSTVVGGVRDQNASVAGAQTDVVACADRAGTATLLGGLAGGTLAQIGGTVMTTAAVAGDNCPAGLGFVARFSGVTVPESMLNADGTLATATRLRVTLADAANAASVGTSGNVDVWVDSIAPTLTLMTPADLCGDFAVSSTTVTQPVTFTTNTANVVVQVENGAVTDTYMNPTFASGVATFSAIDFDTGANNVTAVATDPAGNTTSLTPVPCTFTVGSAPVVVFNAPLTGQVLCPVGSPSPGCIPDSAAGTPGWQGNLSVHVSGDGQPITSGTVTFTVGAMTLGTANLDTNGNAALTGVTLPNGNITIVATTSSIPNRGIGMGSVTVTVVDDVPPTVVTGLTALVLDRRQTSFQLTWTAPNDDGAAVTGYEIRYAKVPITDGNFDDTAVTTAVPYTGQPAAPGQTDGIAVQNLYIENDYYFAIKARDVAGNRGAIAATGAAARASFIVTVINSPAGTNERFGYISDGSGDLNGDGIPDLVVGTFAGSRAYLFFGAATFAPSAPAVTLSGAATAFGLGLAQIGDIDNDGREDLAVADTTSRAVYIYRGRATWPLALTNAEADYVISTDASYASSNFGSSIARLGDFDGDGVDDFAIGANSYSGVAPQLGRVVIVRGRTGFANVALPDTSNTITIDGDQALTRPFFGFRVLGLGRFYSAMAGNTLLVSAPGGTTGTTNNEGRVYAFHGQTGSGGAIPIASADHVITGPGVPARIGFVLSHLGPIMGSLPNVGIGNPADTLSVPGSSGNFFITSGTESVGPFANRKIGTQAGGIGAGQVIFGGGLSGLDGSRSIIGSALPDIGTVPTQTGAIHIIDGAAVAGLPATFDVSSVAAVRVNVPAGWAGISAGGSSLIPDIDSDGYSDFVVGGVFGAVPGAVAVYH